MKMRIALLALMAGLLAIAPANASQKTKAQLAAQIQSQLPSSGQGLITAAILRGVLQDMVDSDQQILLVNSQIGTAYTFAASDQGKIVTFNNPSPIAASLPQSLNAFGPGYSFFVQNVGAGTVTITPSVSTINGVSTLSVTSGQAALLAADNNGNYIAITLSSGSTPLTDGAIFVGNSSNVATPRIMSQDCTLSNTGVITCTKTNNVSFSALSTLVPGTGVATWIGTPSSANLAAAVTDETGSGSLVFATSPTLVTPNIGAATATSINRLTVTAPATSATLTVANGKTLTSSNTLTMTGTDGSSMNFGVGGTVSYTIASGQSSLATSAISSGTCATVVTATATGVATTDSVSASFSADPTSTTGYIPSTSGMLTIIAYPTSNNVNFKVCNNTLSSITPGAVTVNWRVTR